MDFKQALGQVQTVTNQDLEDFFTSYRQRSEAIDPWAVVVVDRLAEYCLRPGKRIRALLVAIGAALSQDKSLDQVLHDPVVRQAMVIVELKHARLLIVDDVGDRDDQRRGEPAFHKKWELDLQTEPLYQKFSSSFLRHIARSYTEVAGAQLDAMATWLLMDPVFTDEQRRVLLEIMQEHIYDKTTTGWYVIFDQNYENLTNDTSEERLLKGLELVSGEYTFVGPLRMGMALGSKLDDLDQHIRAYGQAAGIVFQIKDDILGTFGDPDQTGKPVGNDLREGKKTLLVQHAFQNANSPEKKTLAQLVGKNDITESEIKKLQAIIKTNGGLDYARKRAQDFANQAIKAAKQLPPSQEQALLVQIIDYIQSRNK